MRLSTSFSWRAVKKTPANGVKKMSQMFYVGSYTNADFGTYKATGKGIYTCKLEPETGNMELLDAFEDVVNPTYLTLDRARTHLYAVHETSRANNPSVSAFAVNDDASLAHVNTQGMTGAGPCHLALDGSEKFSGGGELRLGQRGAVSRERRRRFGRRSGQRAARGQQRTPYQTRGTPRPRDGLWSGRQNALCGRPGAGRNQDVPFERASGDARAPTQRQTRPPAQALATWSFTRAARTFLCSTNSTRP